MRQPHLLSAGHSLQALEMLETWTCKWLDRDLTTGKRINMRRVPIVCRIGSQADGNFSEENGSTSCRCGTQTQSDIETFGPT